MDKLIPTDWGNIDDIKREIALWREYGTSSNDLLHHLKRGELIMDSLIKKIESNNGKGRF